MLHHPLGYAAHPKVFKARPSMSGHDHEIDREIRGLLDDAVPGYANLDRGINRHPGGDCSRQGFHLLPGGFDQVLGKSSRHSCHITGKIKIAGRHQGKFDHMKKREPG